LGVSEPGKMAGHMVPPDRGTNANAVEYEYVKLRRPRPTAAACSALLAGALFVVTVVPAFAAKAVFAQASFERVRP
jgi:hypothetical protein